MGKVGKTISACKSRRIASLRICLILDEDYMYQDSKLCYTVCVCQH